MAIKKLTLALGLFEFLAVAQFWFAPAEELVSKHLLLPNQFIVDPLVKNLYCAYILTLGLQRLTFAFGNQSFLSWVALLGTHVVEAALWWSLALAPRFNTSSLSPLDMVKKAVHLELPGGPLTTVLLVGVPVLITLFLVLGPARNKAKKIDKSS